jgi:hypothetical protein
MLTVSYRTTLNFNSLLLSCLPSLTYLCIVLLAVPIMSFVTLNILYMQFLTDPDFTTNPNHLGLVIEIQDVVVPAALMSLHDSKSLASFGPTPFTVSKVIFKDYSVGRKKPTSHHRCLRADSGVFIANPEGK